MSVLRLNDGSLPNLFQMVGAWPSISAVGLIVILFVGFLCCGSGMSILLCFDTVFMITRVSMWCFIDGAEDLYVNCTYICNLEKQRSFGVGFSRGWALFEHPTPQWFFFFFFFFFCLLAVPGGSTVAVLPWFCIGGYIYGMGFQIAIISSSSRLHSDLSLVRLRTPIRTERTNMFVSWICVPMKCEVSRELK